MDVVKQQKILASVGACEISQRWVDEAGNISAADKWGLCERPDWLLWLAVRLKILPQTIDIINIRTLLVIYGAIESKIPAADKVDTLRLLKNIYDDMLNGMSRDELASKYALRIIHMRQNRSSQLSAFYGYIYDTAYCAGQNIFHYLSRSLLSMNIFYDCPGRDAALHEQLGIIREQIPWHTIHTKLDSLGLI